MTSRVYETTVEYNADFDEYYLTLPEELTDSLGWSEGDVVEWKVNKDGTVLMELVDNEFGGTENDEN